MDTTITLSWDAPTELGGDTSVTYRIDVSTTGDTFITLLSSHGDTSYTHSGLNRGDTYFYRIYSVNSTATSLTYASANETIDAIMPNPPTSFHIERLTPLALDLFWTAPTYDGGSPLSGYRIFESSNGITFNLFTTVAGDTYADGDGDTYHFRRSLSDYGARRYYRIYSYNTVGNSADYLSADGRTDSPLNPPPNLIATEVGDTSISLEWDAPSLINDQSSLKYFVIQVQNLTEGDSVSTLSSNYGDSQYTHTGLVSGDTYVYSISADNEIVGESVASTITVTTDTVPGIPTNFMATASGQTAVDLSWSPPIFDGGDTITRYEVYELNRTLYAIENNVSDDNLKILYTVDVSEGTVSRAHPTNTLGSGNWGTLGFHNGKLYTIDNDDNVLYEVGRGGITVRVHPTNEFSSVGSWRSLASLSGNLYSINDTIDSLFTIDVSDGTATRVHSTNTLGSDSWSCLATHNGVLYAAGNTTNVLYTINEIDGTASRVHSTNTLGSGSWGGFRIF